VFAPGLRVEIRDAEWVIKRAGLTSSGTYSLPVTGISELVRGKEARFLTEIDRDIKTLHPKDTELVPDASPRFANARLYLASPLPVEGRVTHVIDNAACSFQRRRENRCVMAATTAPQWLRRFPR
jgi:hypothetical protein